MNVSWFKGDFVMFTVCHKNHVKLLTVYCLAQLWKMNKIFNEENVRTLSKLLIYYKSINK